MNRNSLRTRRKTLEKEVFLSNNYKTLRCERFVYTEDVGSSSLSSPTIFYWPLAADCEVVAGSLNLGGWISDQYS